MENHYELLYLVSVKYTGDELLAVSAKVNALIKAANGQIMSTDSLGKLRLAYPIKTVSQASYEVIEFDAPRENLKALERELILLPEVLRHLITIKRVKGAEEVEHEKRVQDKLLKQKENELAATETVVKPSVEAPAEPVQPVKEKAAETGLKIADRLADVEIHEKKEKGKVSLEDLDKKLDEILTDDIL
jgi:ribosomal protein S6